MCNSSKQPVFVSDNVDLIYLWCQACNELHILLPCYPYLRTTTEEKSEAQKADPVLSEQPSTLPYPATAENVGKLKQSLIDNF